MAHLLHIHKMFAVVVCLASLCLCRAAMEQIRITLTGIRGEMLVSWASDEASAPIVQFGMQSGKYIRTVKGDTNSYKTSDYQSKYIHFALLDQLIPGNMYYYVCGDDVQNLKSAEFSFRMPDYAQHAGSIAIVGDLGQTFKSVETAESIISDPANIDLALIVGDISYADGDQKLWDSWGNKFQFLTSRMSVMTLPGNHEKEQSSRVNSSFLAYKSRFRMPSNGEPSERNLFWSIDYSYLHIVALSTETDFSETSAQFQWFVRDMEKVNRVNTPFVIVMFHRPFYNSNLAHQKEIPGFRALYEDYFHRYGVDAVFCGHVHAYERTHPVYKDTIGKGYTQYFTIGDGGNREGLTFFWWFQPKWSAHRKASYGYGRFDMFNHTHLRFSLISEEFLTPLKRHVPSDSVWIIKETSLV